MLVLKFGGTSVKDAAALGRAAGFIARAPDSRRVVVVSAMAGVTDRLFEVAHLAARGDRLAAARVIDELAERHLAAATIAGSVQAVHRLRKTLQSTLGELRVLVEALAVVRELAPRTLDAVAATGELMSSRLMAAALAAQGHAAVWVDPRTIVVTDDQFGHAEPRLDATTAALSQHVRPLLARVAPPTVVTGGYVGATADGVTTTLGRGGSDYSAAILGACLRAREIQIWTDVDGLLTADPRLVPEARSLPWVSPDEAAELARFGAKVLHPRTVAPAAAVRIPIRILNSYEPRSPGTLVAVTGAGTRPRVAAVACKRGVGLVDLRPRSGVPPFAVLARTFEACARFDAGVDVVTLSVGHVAVAVDDATRAARLSQAHAECADVTCRPEMAILAVVGDGLCRDPRLVGRVLAAFDDLPVHLVCHAASRRSVVAVVPDAAAPEVSRQVHERLRLRTAAASGAELEAIHG